MKSNRKWYQLAGSLSLVALLALSLVWVVSVAADHDADEVGTITVGKPVVSPDQAKVASADRVVAVTVTDEDLDTTLFVGEGPNAEVADSPEIVIELNAPLTFGDTFRVSLIDGAAPDSAYTIIGDAVNQLPLVDRNRDGGVTEADIVVVLSGDTAKISLIRLFDAINGQLQFSADSNIGVGDRFILRWATSGPESAIVKVEGDAEEMSLSLQEGAPGVYSGSFVIADEATINIGAVDDEQHLVPAGLLADHVFPNESHIVGSNLVTGDTFDVTLDFAPVDIDGNTVADGAGIDDIAIAGAASTSLKIALDTDVNAGGLQVKLTGTANADVGDAFTLTYGRSIVNESITVPNTGDAGFNDQGAIGVVDAGDSFVVKLTATPIDANDDGVVTTTDITINPGTATTITVAVDADVNVGGDGNVQFTISGDEAGQTFTVTYVGQVVQNETVPATGLQPGETQVITLSNPPLRDANADDLVDSGDITVNLTTIVVDVVTGDDGGLTVRNSSAAEILDGTQFAVTYSGSDQFTITLIEAPVTSAVTIGSLVVPAAGNPGALYQINEVDASAGTVRIGVLVNTPATGTVLGVTYAGSEQHTPPGVSKNTGDEFVILLANVVLDGADAGTDVGPADVVALNPVKVTVLTVTGDLGTLKVRATEFIDADETFSFTYVRPANFNAQNALDPSAPGALNPKALPIVSATSGTQALITYEDSTPNVDVELTVGVESDAPVFEAAAPENGSSKSASAGVDFSIEISDVGEAGVDADTTDTVASSIRFVLTTDRPPVGGFSDPTALAVRDFVVTADSISGVDIFTATLALDSANLTLAGLAIPAGFVTTISWWVEATDKAGNAAITDADADVDGNQAYTFSIDAVSATIVDSFTGDWWDPVANRVKGSRGAVTTGGAMDNSIRIVFSEAIKDDSVVAAGSAFTVEGFTVIGADLFAGAPTSVFLTVSPGMDPSDTPKVSLVGTITDLAENPAATGDKTPKDGIAPSPTAVLSTDLTTSAVTITVTSDENIRTRRPALTLFITGDDGNTRAAGIDPAAITPSATEENTWTFDFTIAAKQTYSVVVGVEDAARNAGAIGVDNPESDGAVIFEVDTNLPQPTTDPVDANNDNIADDDIAAAAFVFIALDWSGVEKNEYPGDTHTAVNLTSAILDAGTDAERDLIAEGVASVRNGNEWSLGISGVDLGEHKLTYNGTDDAGNTLGVDGATLTFTVSSPPPFVRNLTTGMNLISLPGRPENGDINAIFGDVPQVNLVFTRDGDRWLVAERNSATGLFEGNLSALDSRHAYWVRATANADLSVQIPPLGALEVPPEIPVMGGKWNLVPVISLLPIGPNAATQIQAGSGVSGDSYLGASWTRAFTFDGRNWIRIEPGANDNVEIGNGYWVFFTANGTLVP